MEPKEKAKELFDKFYLITKDSTDILKIKSKAEALTCSLTCVNEILELNVCWYDEQLVKDYPKSYKNNQTIEFWEEVKNQLLKM